MRCPRDWNAAILFSIVAADQIDIALISSCSGRCLQEEQCGVELRHRYIFKCGDEEAPDPNHSNESTSKANRL